MTGDPLLKAFDGWRKLAVASGHVVDAAGANLSRTVFAAAIKAMPRKFKQRRQQLRFYAGSNLIQDYLFSLASDATTPDDIRTGVIRGAGGGLVDGQVGGAYAYAFGIPVIEVPLMIETKVGTYTTPTGDHGDVELTFPQNRIWGVKREIVVYREFKPKKDTIEYTMYCRVGVQIENADAYVIVRNVKVQP